MRNRWMMMCCVLALAVGCGKDENNANNTNNGTNQNNENNTANNENNSNNANNTSNNENNSNNTSNNPNNPNGNPRTEPYITRFSYYIEDDSIGASDGYTISVVSGDIANQDGNTRTMTMEDASMFETTHMTAATVDKMRNGWDCPEVGDDDMGMMDMGTDDMGMDMGGGFVDESRHIFEARIQEDGIVTEIQDVSGCVDADTPEVTAIIEAMNTLGESYL